MAQHNWQGSPLTVEGCGAQRCVNRGACLVVEWKSVLTFGDEVLLEELGIVYERRL